MILQVEHLTKAFGDHLLFRDLTFSVSGPAVLWAPSGWGKTTLLRILLGLEQPDSGTIAGVGRTAAVFQEDRLCPQLSAVENVLLVLPDGKARRQAVEADFALLGMAVEADFALLGMSGEALILPAARLSGGQKRRAALLRAVWAKADTRLLDEPFTGLDPVSMEQAAALLNRRCAGAPALLATHDRAAIQALGWPVIHLDQLPKQDPAP